MHLLHTWELNDGRFEISKVLYVLIQASFNSYKICWRTHTLHYKKEKKIFLKYKETLKGSGAKSFRKKGFLLNEAMRKYLVIYGEAVSHIWLCTRSLLNFLIYEENFLFFFNSVKLFCEAMSAWELSWAVVQSKRSNRNRKI